jgi:hypothetical protein
MLVVFFSLLFIHHLKVLTESMNYPFLLEVEGKQSFKFEGGLMQFK